MLPFPNDIAFLLKIILSSRLVITFAEDSNGAEWYQPFPRLETTDTNPDSIMTHTCTFQGTTAGACLFPELGRNIPSTEWLTFSTLTVTAAPTPIFTITQSSSASASWNTGDFWGVGGVTSLAIAVIVTRLTLGL
jgi:hypothetical protein